MKTKNVVTKTALETLQEKSANAVGVIRTTIEGLKNANNEIDAEHEANVKRIATLTDTNASLEELKAGNSKVISNFESLLA